MEQAAKARAILTDEELALLVNAPNVDGEIRLLVLLSRTVAGLRAGARNALDWTALTPGFATCTFVRRKIRKTRRRPETHVVLEDVRPFLAASHVGQGSPIRRELWRAGIRRHELHFETTTTLPVDFHSTRRAYASALSRVGANDRQIMKLGAWSTAALIARYDEKDAIRALPPAAVRLLMLPAEFSSSRCDETRGRSVLLGPGISRFTGL